jgi:hypothetical protein
MLRPTVSRPVCLGIKHPSGDYDQYYCQRVASLLMWGVLSDERTGLSFVYATDPCQRSLSRVRVPWDLRPYFTLSDLRLPFSSPPTTRKVTVEVFDPASTRETQILTNALPEARIEITASCSHECVVSESCVNSGQRFCLYKRIRCCGNAF